MQRSFSTFPARWPGAGLLLLRGTVGITVALQAAPNLFHSGIPIVARLIAGVAILCSLLLLIGLLTPVAALFVSLGTGILWLRAAPAFLPSGLSPLFIIVLAAAIVMLGPGAYSLDGRRFGRREIVIPL